MRARAVTFAAGLWLVLSAYLWGHSPTQQVNALVCGVAALLFTVLAVGFPLLRFLNMLLGAWLVLSVFRLPHAGALTLVNNLAVGLLLVLASPRRGPTEEEFGRGPWWLDREPLDV